MNPFTKHTQNQGVSYMAHLIFATGIAMRLLNSVVAFVSHGIFPFINIRRSLDLEETSRFLQERNHWIETKKIETKKATKETESVAFRYSWQRVSYSEPKWDRK